MMQTTQISGGCPRCGAPVPADAPQGLCPKCVLAGAAAASEPAPPPTSTSEIPSLESVAAAFPQLQIIELIGRGGMGFVFKARQPHLDRFVALKLLPDRLAREPRFAERFNREGRVLARLNHPNIVTVFDFGQAGPYYFLLMEYVDGANLRQAMQAGRFSTGEALAIVPRICEALQYAHEQGILHRDIKPENILLDARGRVKIADFGIAKLVGEEKSDLALTATGAAIGTPHYMAPEQIEKPATVDHRADIYSLGVVFYEMLTGELPIGRFALPSQKTPVDSRVDDVVMRTLEKEREKRFQSAGEVQTSVEHLTQSQGAGGLVARSLAPSDDFILCPPVLPRMAKAIIIYALVIAPLLWFLGLFAMEPLPKNDLVAFARGALNVLVSVADFLVVSVLALGAWKLRGLRPSAPAWLQSGFWAHLGLAVIALSGEVWVSVLTEQLMPNAPAWSAKFADGVVLAILVATVVFEIGALVWLRRHKALLRSLCPAAAPLTGPAGTIVVPPGAPPPSLSRWSGRAIWGAALTGLSFLVLLLFFGDLISRGGGMTTLSALTFGLGALAGLAGTILGWMALSDIRAGAGRLRGLALGIFAGLSWPLLLLGGATLTVPYFVLGPAGEGGTAPGAAWLLLLVPAGTITFALWAIRAAARWGSNQPPTHRRGVLKWVFLGLLACGIGVLLARSRPERRVAPSAAMEATAVGLAPDRVTNAVSPNVAPTPGTPAVAAGPSIRFIFTAVELREEQGTQWLAFDYVDQTEGNCERGFKYLTDLPDFKAQTRMTAMITGEGNPPVRHQRVEFRMPGAVSRGELLKFRDALAKRLVGKSGVVRPGEEYPLFKLPVEDKGTLAGFALALQKPTTP